MTKTGNDIIVLGAYGYTGKLIVEKLTKNGIGITIAGRNRKALNELKSEFKIQSSVVLFDVYSDEDIKYVIANFTVIINCIGPYNLYGQKLLKYVVASGCIYFDICGEQEFIINSFNSNSELAERSGTCMVHSLSFESCLADLLAEKYLDKETAYSDISTYYLFNNDRPSPGTRFTMQIHKHFASYAFLNGEMIPMVLMEYKENPVDYYKDFKNAVYAPYPEVYFFAKHYKVMNCGTYVLHPLLDMSMLKLYENQPLKTMEEIIEINKRKKYTGPDSTERQNQQIALIVRSETETGKKKHIHLEGKVPYMITAGIMENAVMKLFTNPHPKSGIQTPAKFFNDPSIINDLAKTHSLKLFEQVIN